ncbi:MAG: hypothetical protein M1834_004769 [Cirrosporium novae-zelandiae]|nr:MAG: hypothetical protein M1834_004769 [Cirrosporium novae-zelandiae]
MIGDGNHVATGDSEPRHNRQTSEDVTNGRAKEKVPGHKRSISGSLLAKLPFLRGQENIAQDGNAPYSYDGHDDGADPPPRKTALASALYQEKKTRRRKGSLRKAALLGTGRLRGDGRERRSTLDQVRTAAPGRFDGTPKASVYNGFTFPRLGIHDDDATPRPSFDPTKYTYTNGTLPSLHTNMNITGTNSMTSPNSLISPTQLDVSSTDEDDLVPFPHYPIKSTVITSGDTSPSTSPDSYFPKQPDFLPRPKPDHRVRSPLATNHSEISVATEEWDYSDTEWWGWIILLVTWIVFVVGMGSCLGVWSWAWDVGETPYAPPELEDDPTLPIVGYYPPLIILTGVMAWVWVIVAWVGMKYFKHAQISGEDAL